MSRFLLTWVAAAVTTIASADFPTPRNTEPLAEPGADRPAEMPMDPHDATAAFELPADLTSTLIAAEPDVQNPIAMAWDNAGRMFVAENYTYAQRPIRFEPDLRDRVVVFTGVETNQPKRQVFIDTVTHLTGVETGYDAASRRRGVYLMCPPQLLFVPDEDADLVPDGPPEVVLDGFTVADANHHNFANGIRFGADGWLYGRCGGSCPGRVGTPGAADADRVPLEGGIWRYDTRRQLFEVICHGTTNPWGHDFNEVGELFFINTVNGHLWHGIEGAHFKRPFTLDPNPNAYELIDQHADHYHFDTTGAWNDSRNGAANDYGGGHAHSGLLIYQSDTLPPSYRGDVYTLNFHGRRINRETLHEHGSGYVAKHGEDLFLSADPWFRGIDLQTGPDGRIYVIDWSDTGECHENTGVHRTSGRIYAIGPADESRLPIDSIGSLHAKLGSDDADQLAELIIGNEKWFSDRATLELRRLAAADPTLGDWAIEELQPLAENRKTALGSRVSMAMDACWNHPRMSERLTSTIKTIDDLEGLREYMELMRRSSDLPPIDHCRGPHPLRDAMGVKATKVTITGQTSDSSARARRQAASRLQRLAMSDRYAAAKGLCRVRGDAEDHNLPLLVWYGLMNAPDSDAMQMRLVLGQSRWPVLNRQIGRWLGERIESQEAAVEAIGLARRQLQSPGSTEKSLAHATLVGLARGAVGATQPAREADLQMLDAMTVDAGDDVRDAVRQLQGLFSGKGDLAELTEKLRQSGEQPTLALAAFRSIVANRLALGLNESKVTEFGKALLRGFTDQRRRGHRHGGPGEQ